MKFECPSCSRKTTASEIEKMDYGVVACLDCGTEYHILGYNIDADDLSHKQTDRVPKGIILKPFSNGTRIQLKKNKGRGLAIIWAIMVFSLFGLMASNYSGGNNAGKLDFVGILTLTGIFLTVPLAIYRTFRNQYLDIFNAKMVVGYSFFGWTSFNKEFKIADLEQFFVKKSIHKRDSKRYASYSLQAQTKDQQSINLIAKIKGFQSAFFLEQELEHFYGIVDERLMGEFDPRKELPIDFNIGDSYRFVKKVIQNTHEEQLSKGQNDSSKKELYKENLQVLVKKIEQAKRYRSY